MPKPITTTLWIAPDGTKFPDYEQAVKYEIIREVELMVGKSEWAWLDKPSFYEFIYVHREKLLSFLSEALRRHGGLPIHEAPQ